MKPNNSNFNIQNTYQISWNSWLQTVFLHSFQFRKHSLCIKENCYFKIQTHNYMDIFNLLSNHKGNDAIYIYAKFIMIQINMMWEGNLKVFRRAISQTNASKNASTSTHDTRFPIVAEGLQANRHTLSSYTSLGWCKPANI